jgi:mono/diheme cytochrome c family protein
MYRDPTPAARPASGRRATLAAALGCSLLLGACIPMDNALQAIFGRSMQDQVSFDPYENPLMPAEGAVSFASGNHPGAPGEVNLGQPEGNPETVPVLTPIVMAQALAGTGPVNEMVNPIPATAESLERGKVVYDRMCAICHGPLGAPAEAAILPKLPAMVAFPLAAGGATVRTDGYLYGMIVAGRGIMPPYGHQIAHYDRWHVVNYIRQLQGRVPAGGVTPDAAAGGAN